MAAFRLVPVLFIIITSILKQIEGCPAQCRVCDTDRVVCTQAGLRDIPSSLPKESMTIDLTQNEVTSLQGLPPLPNTMSMRLAGNKISLIEGRTFAKVPQLMSLDLSMNQIRKIYKQGFKGLDDVMTISLNGNLLTTIGKVFMNTPALTTLRLSFNKITKIEQGSFENNNMLKMLDLSNNFITTIHPKAFESLDMLRILILSNNPLGTLPELSFTSNILTLADFTNCGLTAVPRQMPASLNDFRLGNNKITKIFADDFTNITELNLLTLNDNKIADVEHRSFYYLENLKELWMSRNTLVYIPRGLPMHLEKFHIDNNQVVEFEPMLFKAGSILKVLSLEANNIQKIHRDAVKELKHIESLNLQGNKISELEAGTFANLDHLKMLSLANNPIQKIHDGAFVSLDNLTELSLAYIDGQTLEQKILTENLLESMPQLESLDLMSSVYLTKDLLEKFDANTKPMENIKIVNLQYNDLRNLPESLGRVFANTNDLTLDGNILTCDKRLVWLNKWMKSSAVRFHQYEPPVCHDSGAFNGKLISELSEDEFIEVSDQNQLLNNQQNQLKKPDASAIGKPVASPQVGPQQYPPSRQSGLVRTLSGSRQQAVSKYDNPGPVYDSQAGGSSIQPQGNNQSPARSSAGSVPYYGTRVIIKPPRNDQIPTKKGSGAKLTKAERDARKAARRAQRLRDKEARRRAKKQRDQGKARRKRRIRKQCTTDENGVVKCERRRRKRCTVQPDGTVKCRKRKGGKKAKSRKQGDKSVN